MWIRFSVAAVLEMLDRRFGDLGDHARHYYASVTHPQLERRLLVGPTHGSNYLTTTEFNDHRRLAVMLFFDAVSTARNALGRAAQRTRKFYVFSFRIANLAFTARDSDCILPLAIVPPAAWEVYGFDGVVASLMETFASVHQGTSS